MNGLKLIGSMDVTYGIVIIVQVIVVATLPIGVTLFLYREKANLMTEIFIERYGTLYTNLRVYTKVSNLPLWNPGLFMFKRFLIAMATVALTQHNFMLVTIYVFIQLFSLGYVIS